MRTRHLAMGLVALVAAAAIGLPGPPASAFPITITGDTLDLYGGDGTPVTSADLGTSAPVSCSADGSDMTFSGGSTGTWSLSLALDHAFAIGTTNVRAVITGTISGTYTSTALTGTGDFVLAVRRTTGSGVCTYLTTAGTCTVTATSVGLSGTHGAVSGDNAPAGDLGFEVDVTGTATDCGSLIAVSDGSVEIALTA
jgi:hypothetical protein